MKISYQNEPLFPGEPARFLAGKQLYSHYEQSGPALTKGVHWFDFQTNVAHTLNVNYCGRFFKMVLCIAGESRSLPRYSDAYGFKTGQALFYKTEEGPYEAALAGHTRFKVIHLHLSEAHVAMLQKDAPYVFDKNVQVSALSAACTQVFSQLKSISHENVGLLSLLEEKLIIDQLYSLASRTLPRTARSRAQAILEEAIWHIHRSDQYLTIAELSRLAGTNSFFLKQLFREHMQTSVFQYQSDLRLERAARLLLDTDLNISAVALECGYESAAAFSNAFRRKYKVRPVHFKNSRTRS